ncbi:putative dehydrogenase [Paenibacillus intestini]|uniref:Gfo/Idh/MocA family oxidoreductase n=1 Tax=Paenibacillus cucumis (ex Kampfer et al. 2016) TaxID=1776858 RepID=A0ABS7KT51_9BACL|nr:Gfo/Idh/MocA family oxidoreductase [Paenibacillus cucumis (ex Kampfer et al. 2016)]MBY0207116.1 Gfo/Idh/MocA family oxidoreductase [Paenibacillus cucumis (ex Kampfer et al. 2016)]MDP9698984.1 putative dehydrogenase [Paenibacillus intestini]
MRIGIAGYGRIVELMHNSLIRKVEGLELTAIYDVTEERRKHAEARGLQTYSNLDLFLSDALIDVVLIAAPTQYHYSIALKALQYGKHLIIEKPVAMNAQEAIEIQKKAIEMNRVVTLFHNRRFDPDFQFVQSILKSSEIGKVLFLERSHHMDGAGVEFGIQSYNPKWRIMDIKGGGVLLDWGVHLIDQLQQLNLGSVVSFTGSSYKMGWHQGDADDYVNSTIAFENGLLATIEIHSLSNVDKPSWTIVGERGSVVVYKDKAFVNVRGATSEMREIPRLSRFASEVIYTSFLLEIEGKGKCIVTLDEAIKTMHWIDQIRKNEVLMGEVSKWRV